MKQGRTRGRIILAPPITGRARPFGQPSVDDFLRQLVEFVLGVRQALFDRGARLGDRQAANVGIEVVRRLLQRRGRNAGG